MVEIITIFATFVIMQLVFLVLKQRIKIQELERERDLAESSKTRWVNLYWSMQESVGKGTSIPPDTIKAVKYAMKHAHPDNGGNAEDFIKFQKCYEELTRK